MTETLPRMWTVYDHPTDYPHHYVAREFVEGKPSNNYIMSSDIKVVREHLQQMYLTRIERYLDDDPAILEVWL